jgi:hypothetical protein
MNRQLRKTLAVLGLACMTANAACAGPLLVSAITSKENRIRFAYQQLGTANSGVINCNAGATGELEGCQHQRIVWVGDQKRGVTR